MNDDQGMKRCGFGKGHMAPRERFYANRTKPDGLNGICIFHQGMVNERNKPA